LTGLALSLSIRIKPLFGLGQGASLLQQRCGAGILWKERFVMSKKVFVGGIPWSTTDEDLRQAFTKFGEIEQASVVRERETGRSRGFGFVTFIAEDSANAAINEMNGKELGGRTIKVDSSHERPPRRG
jgi:RNA recognition motif-containing protein